MLKEINLFCGIRLLRIHIDRLNFVLCLVAYLYLSSFLLVMVGLLPAFPVVPGGARQF